MKRGIFAVLCLLTLAEVTVGKSSNLRHTAATLSDLQTLGHVAHVSDLHRSSLAYRLNEHLRMDGKGKPVENVADVAADLKQTVQKIADVNIPEAAHREYMVYRERFMPGFAFVLYSTMFNVIFLSFAMVWFCIFFKCIYENDRLYWDDGGRWKEHLSSEKHQEINAAEERMAIRPDLMLVFHHPEYKFDDSSSKASVADFDQVLISSNDRTDEGARQHLRRTSELRRRATMVSGSSVTDGPTWGEARIAFLQDLCQELHALGMTVWTFRACDGDELFLSVKLSDKVVTRHYLYQQDYYLRVNKKLIPKLGIDQPPDVPTPMMRYNPKVVHGLHKSKTIENDDENEVFRTHGEYDLLFSNDNLQNSDKLTIVGRRDRIRMIYTALSDLVDLEAAVHAGFLRSWYGVHNGQHHLRIVKATWGSIRLLSDFSFVQPVLSLNTYFGMRPTFLFAWNGFYCKALLALTPLALMAAGIAYILEYFLQMPGTQMAMVSFNTIIVVWARVAYNLWGREEAYFMQVWNQHTLSQTGQHVIRPRFRGELAPSVQDRNIKEKQYPESLSALRRFAVLCVTLFFCSIVTAFIVIWYDIFGGKLTVASGSLLVLQTKLLEFAWNALTPRLTEFENHKYQENYYNSYVWKNFAFQAVNSYAAYAYLAVKLHYAAKGCGDGSCLAMLQQLLVVVQMILSLSATASLLASWGWVRFKLWYEIYKHRKANDGKDPPSRPRAEEEAMMQKFGTPEQCRYACQLMLSVGFIVLFGGVVPIMVPFSLLLFALNLRVGAKVILNYTQRPFPRKSQGIGSWKNIMLLLMSLGVLFSGFMMVCNSVFFIGTPLITKLTGFILYCLVMRVVWAVVDYIVPEISKEVEILKVQQEHVILKINKRARLLKDGGQHQGGFEERIMTMEESFWESSVSRAAWSEIRPAEDPDTR